MATGATAGVKRTRADVPVYCAHLAAKRARAVAPPPVNVSALLCADGADAARVEARARTLDALRLGGAGMAQMRRHVGDATLALVDLNAHAASVAAVLADFAARGASVVDLNIRSHAYCMGDKLAIARAFIAAHEQHALACALLKWAVTTVFADECAVSVRVLSGGGVRDVLLADWCRRYRFCTDPAFRASPNVIIVTAESGRTFLIPFAA